MYNYYFLYLCKNILMKNKIGDINTLHIYIIINIIYFSFIKRFYKS